MLPYPKMHLLDYFSVKDITDSTTIVTASVASHSCSGKQGYLSGITTEVAVKGDIQFSRLSAYCFPGGTMTVKYTGKLEQLNVVTDALLASSFSDITYTHS